MRGHDRWSPASSGSAEEQMREVTPVPSDGFEMVLVEGRGCRGKEDQKRQLTTAFAATGVLRGRPLDATAAATCRSRVHRSGRLRSRRQAHSEPAKPTAKGPTTPGNSG